MWLTLLWLGGLSLAGCIVWTSLFGFALETGLVMVASVFVAAVAFRGMDRVRRLKNLNYLGQAYIYVGVGTFLGFVVLEIIQTAISLSLWAVLPLACVGWAMCIFARHRLKQAGQLFDLRRVGTLPRQASFPENIKCEGYEAVTGFSRYGSSTDQRGRIFLERETQLPCVIRAKSGSVNAYEIPAYTSWIERKGSSWRESYLHNPFSVPKGIKPTSHVQQALLRDLEELVASLKVTSKELKGRVIEVTPERTSVLLKKYELTPEELTSVCQVLLRVEVAIDDYKKGKAGG